jgi:hypothetical protein
MFTYYRWNLSCFVPVATKTIYSALRYPWHVFRACGKNGLRLWLANSIHFLESMWDTRNRRPWRQMGNLVIQLCEVPILCLKLCSHITLAVGYMRRDIVPLLTAQETVFRYVAPCNLLDKYWQFAEACFIHLFSLRTDEYLTFFGTVHCYMPTKCIIFYIHVLV